MKYQFINTQFIMFISHLGQSFKQCAQIYNQSHDEFNIIQQALPSTAKELSDFQDRTSLLELTLQKVFNIYFKSFNAATVYTPSGELTHEGFLWIRDQKWKKWKKRYFTVKYGSLSIFKVKTGLAPLASYKLLLSTVKPIEDSDRPSCFTIISTEFKQLILQALTSYERDKWINVIQNNIEWLLNNTGSSKPPSSNNSTSDPDDSQLNPHKSMLIKISGPPMNAFCADCGARAPSWVCINWGTVICIQCSGVHRDMTTSVSKVRSTTLDRMDDVTIELFKIIGNLNANLILEELLDKSGNKNQNQNQQQQQQQQAQQPQQYQQQLQLQEPQYQQQPQNQHYQPQYQPQYQQQFQQQQFQQNQQIPLQQSRYQQQSQPQFIQNQNPNQQPFGQPQLQNLQSQPISRFNPQSTNRGPAVSLMSRPMTQLPQPPPQAHHSPIPKCTKINQNVSKETRYFFITQKYKNLAFVKQVHVDIETAIRNKDIISVFRSICTRQIHQFPFALHFAASFGDPLMCRLIALNVPDPNISNGGWTALSYAAFHGQIKAAQTLLISGCSPNAADPKANPYRIAMLKHDEEMAAVFFPYWDKSQVTGELEQPPQKFV